MKFEQNAISQRLKSIELDMLKEVAAICDTLNIRYFLVGGSLLGAVRHKGFIPWDDDVDVGMLREDYNRFVQEAPRMLKSNLFLQTNESDCNYPNAFAKVRNSDTTFIETSAKKIKMNHGIFIDIFPFDYYPEKFLEKKILDLKLKLLSISISRAFYANHRSFKSFLYKIINLILYPIYPSYQVALAAKEKIITKQKKSRFLRNYSGAWGKKEIMPIDWFDCFCKCQFEGSHFWIPCNYDPHLKQLYGDYMTPPPKEKQVAHHYTEVIDLDKSYTFYTK